MERHSASKTRVDALLARNPGLWRAPPALRCAPCGLHVVHAVTLSSANSSAQFLSSPSLLTRLPHHHLHSVHCIKSSHAYLDTGTQSRHPVYGLVIRRVGNVSCRGSGRQGRSDLTRCECANARRWALAGCLRPDRRHLAFRCEPLDRHRHGRSLGFQEPVLRLLPLPGFLDPCRRLAVLESLSLWWPPERCRSTVADLRAAVRAVGAD